MDLRNKHLERLADESFDVLVIGGGINGAVSAASLAARGARVALIDARDFAGFTSQHSSNLVWGGIKYMEGYEFGLVNGLCKSRNELLRAFPSTVREIRFLTTITRGFRVNPLVLYAGTWLYWLLGRGKTLMPKLLSARRVKQTEPLVDTRDCSAGVEYSDAHLHDNDARFVWNFVRSAMDQGCVAANYVESVGARPDGEGWRCDAVDREGGKRFEIRARILVNAAGAFVDRHNAMSGVETRYQHLFSKGIHLIVPQLSSHHRVLAFFADDGRLFFAIPMAHRTCIGTTDTMVEDPETEVTEEDRDFVLSNINARLDLEKPLTRDDVISERCGVRPLAVPRGDRNETDFLQLSRKHVVEIDRERRHISIFGGKLTDCLNVGDEVCELVAALGVELHEPDGHWYGEPGPEEAERFFRRARGLELDSLVAGDTGERVAQRLWRRYGTAANDMLDAIEADPEMAEPLVENAGIRLCEVAYLAESEMIVRLEDYLRRRSKIGQLVPRATLRASAGLKEACRKLFGDDGERKFDEYFADDSRAAAGQAVRIQGSK